jgi:hypothetical protein
MSRKGFIGFVVLPLLSFAAYLATHRPMTDTVWDAIYSEQGFFELATAGCFAAAGCVMFALWVGSAGRAPAVYRVFFIVFSLGAWFVALEEISYGQHIFGWQTPQSLLAVNAKAELNIHNISDNLLSQALRGAGNLVFPIGLLVVPLFVRWRRGGAMRPGSWPYFTLPGAELATLVLIAQSITAIDKGFKAINDHGLFIRPGEVQEFYWSLAVVAYAAILSRRVMSARESSISSVSQDAARRTGPASRAA